MADTNLLVLAREYKKLREEVKKVLSMPKGDKGDRGEKGEKGDTGDTGPQGFPGRDGKDGINGYDGKDGRDGIDGKDGKDGLDGVGVKNAYIDFDNSLVIVLTDGNEINAGYLSQETKDSVIANFKQGAQTLNELLPSQAGNANKFLKTDGENVSWDTLDGSDINLSSPPVIGNVTPNSATFTTLSTGALTATGQATLGGDATNPALIAVAGAGNTRWLTVAGSASANVQLSIGGVGNGNLALVPRGTGGVSLNSGASATNTQFFAAHTASAVNYVQVTGAATNNGPTISAQGSDAAVQLKINAKGGSSISFSGNGNNTAFAIGHVSSATNYLNVAPSVTGSAPTLAVFGTDTNISMAFQSKGTGGISLSTGSTGTNLVNGTSVTAITRTATGSGYTSLPTVAISAPTTAGGVQATASATGQVFSLTSIASGGTGYTVNDVLTVSGTFGTSATITVTAVSGGVITAASMASFGSGYTSIPANPASVTGGTGTGATFNLNWGISTTFNITNAGSGYVEQPTVTFSGGGGSGAAAYATVGSGTTVRSLGSTMSFSTPGGEQVRIIDNGNTAANYWQLQGRDAGGGVLMSAQGSAATVSAIFSSKGTGAVQLFTNNFASEQLRVAHTASAVNYVQVTGAATNSTPVVSAQGSDANVALRVASKGTQLIVFATNYAGSGTGNQQFTVSHTANTINNLNVTGAAAGATPVLSSVGGDTNIGLNLTTKGTGALSVNTGNGEQFRVADSGATTTDFIQVVGSNFGRPVIRASGTGNPSIGISSQGTGAVQIYTNTTAQEQFRITHTASAVNYVQVTGAATTGVPVISGQGSDANVALWITSKGTNAVRIGSGNASYTQLRVVGTNNAVNNLAVTGTTAGNAPILSAEGTDTNIDLALTPKGTGVVQFGTLTATADTAISGYITIKDAGGTIRKLAVIG